MTSRDAQAETLGSMIVTIDGPAGSGKSTTARMLAERLGFMYLDTGAMYRAVTYAVLRRGIDPENAEACTAVARGIDLSFRTVEGKPHMFLDSIDVEREIRGEAVSRQVSPVSRHEGVRRALVRIQRRIGTGGGVVVEGRDTGSVVFPHAHAKLFFVADVDTRVKRRLAQLEGMGIATNAAAIRENIIARDEMDSARAASPLVRPAGAVTIDTAGLTIEDQVGRAEEEVRRAAENLEALAVRPGERDTHARMHLHYRLARALIRGVFRLLFGLRIHGEKNLRYRENFLFASNHLSYADPPVVGCCLNREVWFLAKKELFRRPLFAWLIRTYHAIPINRGEMDRRTLTTVLRTLGGGESILMFPEGTRSRTGALGQFKAGLGFIALQTGVSVVPVLVSGTNELGACLFRRRRLVVRIGCPIRARASAAPDERKRDYGVLACMVRESLAMLAEEP